MNSLNTALTYAPIYCHGQPNQLVEYSIKSPSQLSTVSRRSSGVMNLLLQHNEALLLFIVACFMLKENMLIIFIFFLFLNMHLIFFIFNTFSSLTVLMDSFFASFVCVNFTMGCYIRTCVVWSKYSWVSWSTVVNLQDLLVVSLDSFNFSSSILCHLLEIFIW
jgi:hypothetical protein